MRIKFLYKKIKVTLLDCQTSYTSLACQISYLTNLLSQNKILILRIALYYVALAIQNRSNVALKRISTKPVVQREEAAGESFPPTVLEPALESCMKMQRRSAIKT